MKISLLLLSVLSVCSLSSCAKLSNNQVVTSLVNEAKLNKDVSVESGKTETGYETSAYASTKVAGYQPYVAVAVGWKKVEEQTEQPVEDQVPELTQP